MPWRIAPRNPDAPLRSALRPTQLRTNAETPAFAIVSELFACEALTKQVRTFSESAATRLRLLLGETVYNKFILRVQKDFNTESWLRICKSIIVVEIQLLLNFSKIFWANTDALSSPQICRFNSYWLEQMASFFLSHFLYICAFDIYENISTIFTAKLDTCSKVSKLVKLIKWIAFFLLRAL